MGVDPGQASPGVGDTGNMLGMVLRVMGNLLAGDGDNCCLPDWDALLLGRLVVEEDNCLLFHRGVRIILPPGDVSGVIVGVGGVPGLLGGDADGV